MMFWKPRPVEGTDLEVRPLSGRAMIEFQELFNDASIQDTAKLVTLAQMSVYGAGQKGDPAWTPEEALEQPFPLIKIISDIALEVNGLGGDPMGDAEGN